jgi:N-acetyl-anhydromuramyl-L-alanine amidase AmpD
MASDEAIALWIPSPFFSSRDGAAARWLIIHSTAGGSSAEAIGAWFQNSAAQAAAHYVIGRDGTIVQCVQESNAAWGNGIISGPAGVGGDGVHHDAWWDYAPLWGGAPNPNPVTISIEHVKPHDDNSDALTEPQRASSFALVKNICQRHNIPMRQANAAGGITGHFSMDPVSRSRCPGPYPWDSLWTYLKGSTVNKWQIADALKEWQSTAVLFGGVAPNYSSGIAQVWTQRISRGQRLGPPITGEYDSADWSGNPIKVQQFAHARCEWRVDGSSCRWFDAHGEIL